ncbi:hypothetical protein NQ042_03065 [Corynebacterium phoceense]|uniref:hypothetical protein n=1 Tax=Corynebacterium phoceense TaxID=1686286 RepID=UPI00211C2056|nr:hypothetical protein [Corynebacterium phoceense]MCQ9333090.1 hypothetical protein [Corynebacterium phoceense]MCQ9336757.1 hypothetical protein [Corynebacterium phoceense]
MSRRFINTALSVFVVVAVVGLGLWFYLRDRAPAGAQTVGEAVAELSGSSTNTDTISSNLVTVLDGLGVLTHSPLHDPAQPPEPDTVESRDAFISRMEQAVGRGELTAFEARAVLTAYDQGLITGGESPLVVVDSGETGVES